jgi:uncharacterized protein YceK
MKKILLLFVALIVLGGCSSRDNGRYQSIGNDLELAILDTQTGIVYYGDGYFNSVTGKWVKKKADE